MTFELQAFVHEASLALEHGADPRAPGGAVTVSLCGSWDHEGACRWPHNNEIDTGSAPARFRTVFVADAAESSQIHALIDTALRGGDGWRVLSSGPRAVAPDEQDLAASLLRAPRA